MDPRVDAFLDRAGKWRWVMERLRWIALDCGLEESLKWGKPCFTTGRNNVGIVQGFSATCAFMFFKGALLNDPAGELERPGENSRVARRMVFSSLDEVLDKEVRLRAFIAEAVEVERAGLTVARPTTPDPLPRELEAMFEEVDGLRVAFEALTPGRQRGYVLHFSGARQSKTRRSRIEKVVPRILERRGLRD